MERVTQKWSKEETLYIYFYIFKYPSTTDEMISYLLIQDEWISDRDINLVTKRVTYLRENQNTILLPK